MKKYIVGNWKMNASQSFVQRWAKTFSELFVPLEGQECIVCPPLPYIACLSASLPDAVRVGAQNVCEAPDGAFTGEVSARMLKDCDVDHVIIGHSERRSIYGESNELIASKVVAAQKEGLTVILCIGETLEQRDDVEKVLASQLDHSIPEGIVLDKLIIAYEPVWAIGTGQVASLEDIEKSHKFITDYVMKKFQVRLPLLYGGSVKPGNAADILNCDGVDGVLVGGASLDPQDFHKIYSASV